MELYNEELTDLLSLNDSDKDKRLRLLEDRSGVVVQGLEEVVVKSAAGGEQRGGRRGAAQQLLGVLRGRRRQWRTAKAGAACA